MRANKRMLILTAAVALATATLTRVVADTTTRPAEPAKQAESAEKPETRAASRPGPSPADAQTHADAVIKALMSERAKRPVLPNAPSSRPAVRPAAAAPAEIIQPLPMPPGSMIVDRVGRLVRNEAAGWWTFRFESEKQHLYEAPLRVLPNRHLEAMETILEKSATPGLRFLVTGEVTQYHQRRYLLIRKKLVKRQMGSY